MPASNALMVEFGVGRHNVTAEARGGALLRHGLPADWRGRHGDWSLHEELENESVSIFFLADSGAGAVISPPPRRRDARALLPLEIDRQSKSGRRAPKRRVVAT